MRKILSFDAETDGLWGNPFAIAAIVYEERTNQWVETARFMAMLPNSVVTNQWVKDNVLPALDNVVVTHHSYESMLEDFAKFYLQHKEGADVICHMGFPVEAHLLREMHRLRFIGDWDGPYPLIDIAGNLKQVGEDPTSVDTYAAKHGLHVSYYGTTHHPLYDCEVAARVYIHLTAPPAPPAKVYREYTDEEKHQRNTGGRVQNWPGNWCR